MDFHNSRPIKKTRKDHRCSWCWQMIPKGSAAFYHFGVFDGDRYSGYMHGECEAACRHPSLRDDMLDGWTPGDFARGRVDDDQKAPPQFNPDGSRTAEYLSMKTEVGP